MKALKEECLDLLYPCKCMCCSQVLNAGRRFFCPVCSLKLPFIGEKFCLKCGKYLEDEQQELCRDCQEKKHFFVQNRGIFRYDETMKKVIYRFKYQNQRYFGEYFGWVIADRLGRQIRNWNIEGLIPVPLHKSRQRSRGFNQSEEILKEVSVRLGIPVYPELVIRQKRTVPQKILNEKGREKNLKNAFKIADNSVKLKRVLFLDDIYTTGSTIDALALTLQKAGIEEIFSICLCIGEGR